MTAAPKPLPAWTEWWNAWHKRIEPLFNAENAPELLEAAFTAGHCAGRIEEVDKLQAVFSDRLQCRCRGLADPDTPFMHAASCRHWRPARML